MRVLKGQDLMQGSDHEFIVKLYRRILLRGADEGGYVSAHTQVLAVELKHVIALTKPIHRGMCRCWMLRMAWHVLPQPQPH